MSAAIAVALVLAVLLAGSQTNITLGNAYTGAGAEAGDAATAHIVVEGAGAGDYARVNMFANLRDAARQIAVAEDGWVFIGTRADKVHAVRDEDGDGVAETSLVLASQLKAPHGVAYDADSGDLFLAEIPTIYKVKDIVAQLESNQPIAMQPVITGLPTSGHHGVRHIKWVSDEGGAAGSGYLYVNFGVPCNICEPPAGNALIRRYRFVAGADEPTASEVFARGVRNSVGFDFHPRTGEMWFTDNGRDWLGDDLPHDEINRVQEVGEHFGFPYCHQHDFVDPEFGSAGDCEKYSPPALLTGAHVANLGMAFDRSGRELFVALHGSWNSSVKVGYAVYRAAVSEDGTAASDYRPLLTGFLQGADKNEVLGRPVDVALLPDDSLLVSDDFSGMIYRVSK